MRKRTHRKLYALVNPITLAMQGAAITDTPSLDRLRLLELSALESFSMGRATRDDWKALADLLNLTETMAGMGIGPEALPACSRAQEALAAAHARFKAGGPLYFENAELDALREVAEFHDLQRTSIARSEYEKAIKKCANRIRSASPDVKVLI